MSTTCTPIQQSLKWCEGTPELPGIKRTAYYISKQYIVAYPQLPRDSNDRVTSAQLIGNFSTLNDTPWKQIDFLPAKSRLTSDPQGEYPSQTQLNKLVLVHPGVGKDASAATAYLNNTDCVFIVQDMKGNYRVIGNDKWETKSTVSQDNGEGPTGTASTTINVETTDECPAPFYTGEIVTEDGTINGPVVIDDGEDTITDGVSG